jgi:hypothetical protein
VHDVVALRAQFLGHAIEGLAELSEIAFRLTNWDSHVKIAGRDCVGGAYQAPDRRNHPVGKVEPDPDR